jgi:hypothetical protein
LKLRKFSWKCFCVKKAKFEVKRKNLIVVKFYAKTRISLCVCVEVSESTSYIFMKALWGHWLQVSHSAASCNGLSKWKICQSHYWNTFKLSNSFNLVSRYTSSLKKLVNKTLRTVSTYIFIKLSLSTFILTFWRRLAGNKSVKKLKINLKPFSKHFYFQCKSIFDIFTLVHFMMCSAFENFQAHNIFSWKWKICMCANLFYFTKKSFEIKKKGRRWMMTKEIL